MPLVNASQFSLERTLGSGQVFRFHDAGHGRFFISQQDKFFEVAQGKNKLRYDGVSRQFIREFFRLDDDLSAIKASLAFDRHVSKAFDSHAGMHLMKQDPWQCLVSFVLTSCCNIPRISRNIEALSQAFGDKTDQGFTFPTPGSLDDIGKLKKCGLGYRARYLYELNGLSRFIDFDMLQSLPYEDAKAELTKLPGVGPKVADCVLLFSLGFDHAFPVDVHIKRAVERHYFKGRPQREVDIAAFGRQRFGQNAGYANQYLFCSQRSGLVS